MERRAYAPGQHGQSGGGRRKKASEYAHQLREKQKVKRIYGVAEKPFRNLFEKAAHHTGVTGENLLVSLESRLDNVVYRMGFGASRKEARQLIKHGHVQVNGRKLDIPSAQVAPGDEVRITPKSKDILPVEAALAARSRPTSVAWLAVDEGSRTGRMVSRPSPCGFQIAFTLSIVMPTSTGYALA